MKMKKPMATAIATTMAFTMAISPAAATWDDVNDYDKLSNAFQDTDADVHIILSGNIANTNDNDLVAGVGQNYVIDGNDYVLTDIHFGGQGSVIVNGNLEGEMDAALTTHDEVTVVVLQNVLCDEGTVLTGVQLSCSLCGVGNDEVATGSQNFLNDLGELSGAHGVVLEQAVHEHVGSHVIVQHSFHVGDVIEDHVVVVLVVVGVAVADVGHSLSTGDEQSGIPLLVVHMVGLTVIQQSNVLHADGGHVCLPLGQRSLTVGVTAGVGVVVELAVVNLQAFVLCFQICDVCIGGGHIRTLACAAFLATGKEGEDHQSSQSQTK